MNSDKILVCLYSDSNFLALSILENLLSKNCYVLVVTEDVEKWENLSFHIGNKNRFSFIQKKDISKILYFNYVVFCGGFIRKGEAYKSYRSFLEDGRLVAPKTLVVIPFESFTPKDDALLNLTSRLAVVHVGDLLGPRIDLESDLLAPQVLGDILRRRAVDFPLGERFYPVFVTEAARTLTKWLFSFGPYGKSTFLLGRETSTTDFLVANKKIVGEIKSKEHRDWERRFVPRNYDSKIIPTNLSVSLYETYKWLSAANLENLSRAKIKRQKRYPKYFKPAILTTLTILFLPFVLILLSLITLFFSAKDIEAGRFGSVAPKLVIGKALLTVSAGESKLLKYLPLLGLVYRETEYFSKAGAIGSAGALEILPSLESSSDLINKIFGDNVYDSETITEELGADMLAAYQEFGKFKQITEDAKGRGVLTANFIASKVNLEKIDTFFIQGIRMTGELPSMLGSGERKNYLVLFQNNMELRPTGGFIGSFGILTFDGGRMSNLTVSDVYSADGQLRGHVAPPEPIKNYLGEANWWFRDSNWDPDFPVSAQRAEWFLDKEVDQKVDGVFAIDLNLVRDILKFTGPIFLADYNLDITSDNLYEETQAEVQEEFFPGSHQKASFLSALSRNLVEELHKLESGKRMGLIASFVRNFEGRHVQAYFHNDILQNSVSGLGWSGEVSDPSCGESCYADLVGITEANVGVNKANYFVTRKVDLEVQLGTDSVERKLALSLANTANPALGLAGRYKVYVRVFVPSDSELVKVSRVSGSYEEPLQPEVTEAHGRQEVGIITEVLAGGEQRVEFVWKTKTGAMVRALSYGLYVRKQAGVSDDLWNIALTGAVQKTYNTVLAKDFFTKASFADK